MKKQYTQLIITFCSIVIAIVSIIRCQQREAAAPPAEMIEAAEEASRQVIEQGPASEMKAVAELTAEEPMDSAMKAHMERQYFEALVKIADGGKVYAIDTDGKRSAKAFTRFKDYEKFIANNPQYPRNRYSYDSDGKPFNIDFKTSPNGDGWQIQNKPEAVEPLPTKSE
ncbi:MAG: hypothetical protein IKX11_07245 [Bacteroidales bacterium]|nr:hypothetical protein [Bacteroidales bacterium]